MSVGQTARFIGVSRQAVHRWIVQGHLRAERANGQYFVDVVAVKRLAKLRNAAAKVGVHPATMRRLARLHEERPA